MDGFLWRSKYTLLIVGLVLLGIWGRAQYREWHLQRLDEKVDAANQACGCDAWALPLDQRLKLGLPY